MPTMIKTIPTMPAGFIALEGAASADQVDDYNDQRDDEQEMDQISAERNDKGAEEPENQKYNRDCPKHNDFLELSLP